MRFWFLSLLVFPVALFAQEMTDVPGGSFRMGSDTGEPDERPSHAVNLQAYSIDRLPVTNAQFARFLDAVGPRDAGGVRLYDDDDPDAQIHLRGGRWLADAGYEDRPAIEMSWHGARAYCAWRGARMPTEAEWEKAARAGMERGAVWQWVSSAYRPYPWRADDGREDPRPDVVRGTRGGSKSLTDRGRYVSRNPKAGHHNIGMRCAK